MTNRSRIYVFKNGIKYQLKFTEPVLGAGSADISGFDGIYFAVMVSRMGKSLSSCYFVSE